MTRKATKPSSLTVLASVVLIAVLSVPTAWAQRSSSIGGRVVDSAGMPLVGALVAVQSIETGLRERLSFTDHAGIFSIPNLVAGGYSVKVTKPRFLPSQAQAVELDAGSSIALTLNLQTAMDILRRGIRRGSLEEMKWVLRSAASTRSILQMFEDQGTEESTDNLLSSMDRSGYVQVYSTSVDAWGIATDSVGSQFEFVMPLAADSHLTFSGQYSESTDQPRGFGAEYEFSPRERHRSSLAVNVRQGAMLNGEVGGAESREIKVEYGEQMQWSDHLVLTYGAALGRADGVSSHSYLRPEVGVAWVPQARTTVRASFSRRAPTDTSDPIRGREYFDRAVYIPLELERFSHVELSATRVVSESLRVSIAGFRDHLGHEAFLVDSDDGRRAVMIFDGNTEPTTGIRVHADRIFDDVETGVSYAFARAIGFDQDVVSPDELRQQAKRRNFHVVTLRVKTAIDFTQTAITAVYRWSSGPSLSPVDPYQRFAEYNDPTLSITIAQNLPTFSLLPAKLKAVVDARNLFEPSFGSRRTMQARYPRLLKGGIHFTF